MAGGTITQKWSSVLLVPVREVVQEVAPDRMGRDPQGTDGRPGRVGGQDGYLYLLVRVKRLSPGGYVVGLQVCRYSILTESGWTWALTASRSPRFFPHPVEGSLDEL